MLFFLNSSQLILKLLSSSLELKLLIVECILVDDGSERMVPVLLLIDEPLELAVDLNVSLIGLWSQPVRFITVDFILALVKCSTWII